MSTKAKLKQRICDIVSGAAGRDMSCEDDCYLDPDDLSRAIPVLRQVVIRDTQGVDYLCGVHNLNQYTDVDSITEFYWDNGVRA